MAGVDTKVFSPHSTRSAVVSAVPKHRPVQAIFDSVGWAGKITFTRYYKKTVGEWPNPGAVLLAKSSGK